MPKQGSVEKICKKMGRDRKLKGKCTKVADWWESEANDTSVHYGTTKIKKKDWHQQVTTIIKYHHVKNFTNSYGQWGHVICQNRFWEDPNVFIEDTSATCVTTKSTHGFNNIREAATNNNIIDASGKGIEGIIIGNLSVTSCNQNVKE